MSHRLVVTILDMLLTGTYTHLFEEALAGASTQYPV